MCSPRPKPIPALPQTLPKRTDPAPLHYLDKLITFRSVYFSLEKRDEEKRMGAGGQAVGVVHFLFVVWCRLDARSLLRMRMSVQSTECCTGICVVCFAYAETSAVFAGAAMLVGEMVSTVSMEELLNPRCQASRSLPRSAAGIS